MSEQDPVKRAQALSAPDLPKRFYKHAACALEDGLYVLKLDGRGAKTPAKRPLAVDHAGFAEAMAAEWNAQGTHINPASMPYTRLANSALDGVAEAVPAVIDDIARYGESDLLYYREAETEGLIARQTALWDPVLARMSTRLSKGTQVSFRLASGIQFAEQDAAALTAIREAVISYSTSPLRLAGLQVMTTLTGSVLLSLDAACGAVPGDTAWMAAHVDEDWNIDLWGEDAEAKARRDMRYRDFCAAHLAATG